MQLVTALEAPYYLIPHWYFYRVHDFIGIETTRQDNMQRCEMSHIEVAMV